MKKIVTLTGQMNTGKTILAQKLARNSAVAFIKPYTDRPYYHVYEDCFIFVSKDKLDELIEKEDVLSITTVNGHRYAFFKSQLTEDFNVLIVDDYALVEIQSNWKQNLYSVKVTSKNQKESDRVGVYLYNHEFDEIFDVDNDSIEELEWRIESA